MPARGKRRAPVNRFEHEQRLRLAGWQRLAGIDEAGRGPLAGPVVAAAVILPADWLDSGLPAGWEDLNDSKQLTEGRREEFFELLTGTDAICRGIAIVEAPVIDQLNILRATHQAMVEALAKLSPAPDHLLVDGHPVNSLRPLQTALVKGDSLSYSIAAASVLAKVTRDRLMLEHHRTWPMYGFAEHKGYGTPGHLAALAELGPCAIHRRSFAPLRLAQAELF